MLACAKGDQAAFETIVARHQQQLLNFFRRMGDNNYAEDLTQKTFLRLYGYRQRYQPKAKLKTFIYLLARRVWIDHCRAEGRRREGNEQLLEQAELERDSREQPLLDGARERVRQALQGLSEEMRTVVVMSIYQGFKYREIADIMEIPLGTVKTRMYHALKKIEKELRNEDR